jgi:hypothetical protein
MERTIQSQMFHDKMIKQLADNLVSKKFRDVRADHPDYSDKPAPVILDNAASFHIPDVTAMGIQMVLFDVETHETIHDPHTKEEWESFAAYANRNSAEFWIVVPKASIDDAEERLALLGLNAKVMGF